MIQGYPGYNLEPLEWNSTLPNEVSSSLPWGTGKPTSGYYDTNVQGVKAFGG